MTARYLCYRCRIPVDPDWNGHDEGVDDMGREVFACEDCCSRCNDVPSPHPRHTDVYRVDL